ncbi:hypothetical protein KCT23_002330 [Enterococcus faecium]|nr:hypothetical protein [Enterococcus faecium]
MWGVIYLVLYVIGKLTDLIYFNQEIFLIIFFLVIIIVNTYIFSSGRNKKRRIDKTVLLNLIVIIVGFGTFTSKALISSMILLIFDFLIIYSVLYFINKVREFLNQ